MARSEGEQGTDHIPEGGIARRKSLKPALVDAGGTRNTGAPNFLPQFSFVLPYSVRQFPEHQLAGLHVRGLRLRFGLFVHANVFGGHVRLGWPSG